MKPRVSYLITAADARNTAARDADLFVAMMPEPAALLENEGTPHFIPSDFRDAALFDRRGMEAHDDRVRFIAQTDEAIGRLIPEFASAGFRPFRMMAHTFAGFQESVLWAAHILQESLQTLQPSEVWCSPTAPCIPVRWPLFPVPGHQGLTQLVSSRLHGAGSAPLPRPDLYFRESLSGMLLPTLCRENEIPVRMGPMQSPAASAALPARLVAGDLREVQRGSWVFLSEGYELTPVMRHRAETGGRVISGPELARMGPGRYPAPRLRRALARVLSELSEGTEGGREFWSVFGKFGMAFRPLLRARLEYIMLGIIPALWEDYRMAQTILRAIAPEVVIGGTTGTHWDTVFLPAARSLGMPTVQYSHWWSQQSFPFAWEQLPTADRYLVWEDPERACDGSQEVLTRSVVVGSARLESRALRNKPDEVARIRKTWRSGEKPVVLYMPNWVERTRRFVRTPEEPVHQFRFQRQLLSIFASFPAVDVLWKTLMPWGLDPRSLLAEFPKNVRVVHDAAGHELLWAADLILLDAVSSPLAEAALTRAPILACVQHQELEVHADDLALLRKRAGIHTDPEAFFEAVKAQLARGIIPALDHPDDAFLERKNINPEGGSGAAARAHDAISDLVRSYSFKRNTI